MSVHDEFFSGPGLGLRDAHLYRANPTFANPAWEQAPLRLLILRLSAVADVERSTPHLFLAQEARRDVPGAFLDMAFLPCPADRELRAAHGVPLVVGIQSHRSLDEFDLVYLSNSHLLELVNLPLLLEGSGMPLWASARKEGWPPLVLGGSNAAAAHAVVRPDGDCMADALFFGEAEGLAGRIAALCREHAGLPKAERLARAALDLPGLWPAGDLSRRVSRARAGDGQAAGQGLPFPLLPGPEARTARLAITMGCPSQCTFCFEGHDRKPFRELPVGELLAAARALKLHTGAETLELASFNFNTHSRLAELLEGLNELFLRVNVMSQRADILARTTGLLALELAADKRSFTLGVEGVSARQRRFLRKGLSEADLRKVLQALHGERVREVKLFYLLTGRETAEDLEEFVRFLHWLKEMRRAAEAPPRFLFSVGMLVRMPFTPLRHDGAVMDEAAWRQLAGRVRSACESNGFEFRLAVEWRQYALTQALAAGGYAAHELLEGKPLEAWLAGHGPSLAEPGPPGHPFAFAFLEDEASRESLSREYTSAAAARDRPEAREHDSPDGKPVPAAAIARLTSLMHRKHRLKPAFALAAIPREAAGFGAEWLDAWLLRRLLAGHPDQLGNVLSVRECLVGPWAEGLDCAWFGRTVAAVTSWDEVPADSFDGPAPDGFSPGEFRCLELRLELPGELFPDAGGRLASFLNSRHVPVTVQRAAGGLRYTVPEKALRKKSLLAGRAAEGATGTAMELRVGPKFPLAEFLAEAGALHGASRAAVLEVARIDPH